MTDDEKNMIREDKLERDEEKYNEVERETYYGRNAGYYE